ncbi:glycosyltransferase family 4 protein [Clostridium sporogenes]|uniref:glycosyltransferase family 4 protein n=1 Tax=Clostridium sporogenes TaxID=1509 RepID=UPI0013C92278|nr:glycosyltransferase family 4 protein [Clostridium sporogenes]NFF65031.1 glycosyltransferase family 4 protein [Clostridium sporogenes]
MKIAIIGPYPPPYGGISVHIKRMKLYLENKNIDVTVYNDAKEYNNISQKVISIGSYKKFIFKVIFLKEDILHFHSIDKRIRILLGFYKIFNKKIILSLHGESMHDQIKTSNYLEKKLLNNSLKKIDYITCSNNKIKEDLVFFGVNENKIEVIPEYIKPFETEEDFESIPQNVWEFINNSNFLIAANGWIRFYNDEDLYGVDMLIDLVYELSKRNIQASLIFALLGAEIQSIEEKKYYCKLKNKIKELGIENNIFIFESKNKEFYPILKKSQLFIRPTNTDGNSVSVMEAMDLKIPCITSNACPRPEGVVIFKTRDMDNLIKKTMELIQNYEVYEEKAKYIKVEHNDEKLLAAYKKIIKN